MRWTVFLRCERNTDTNTEVPLLSLERDSLPEFAQLGVIHREGKRILWNLQRALLTQQTEHYFACRRPCNQCGAPRTIKDYRGRILRTVYGPVQLRLPRFNRCQCEQASSPYVWLGADYLPNRSTPEWSAMQAALGARVPYREAAFILNAFAPGAGSHNHGTIRNETIRVGSRITLEDAVIAPGQQPGPTTSGAVAIDGTCVKGHRRDGLSRLNVVVGSVGLQEERKAAFAFVQQHEPHQRKLKAMWQRLGCHESTALHVVTDGDTALHNLVKKTFPGTTRHTLDWFHIAMRLNAIERSIGYGLMRANQSAKVIRQVERELESIHHHLWHGDHELVCPWLGEMVDRIEAMIPPHYLDRYSPLRSTLDKMIDLRNYLLGFQEEVVAYSIAHADKQPVSTAPVESLINRLVNHRMNKRQQMRWSIRGAHHVLQVRVALVNQTLAEIFSRWYPGFSTPRVVEFATLKMA